MKLFHFNLKALSKIFVCSDSAGIFLEIFDDLEEILSTNEGFLLGKWLSDAKSVATNEQVIV